MGSDLQRRRTRWFALGWSRSPGTSRAPSYYLWSEGSVRSSSASSTDAGVGWTEWHGCRRRRPSRSCPYHDRAGYGRAGRDLVRRQPATRCPCASLTSASSEGGAEPAVLLADLFQTDTWQERDDELGCATREASTCRWSSSADGDLGVAAHRSRTRQGGSLRLQLVAPRRRTWRLSPGAKPLRQLGCAR